MHICVWSVGAFVVCGVCVCVCVTACVWSVIVLIVSLGLSSSQEMQYCKRADVIYDEHLRLKCFCSVVLFVAREWVSLFICLLSLWAMSSGPVHVSRSAMHQLRLPLWWRHWLQRRIRRGVSRYWCHPSSSSSPLPWPLLSSASLISLLVPEAFGIHSAVISLVRVGSITGFFLEGDLYKCLITITLQLQSSS